jgi:hypothetical protein
MLGVHCSLMLMNQVQYIMDENEKNQDPYASHIKYYVKSSKYRKSKVWY